MGARAAMQKFASMLVLLGLLAVVAAFPLSASAPAQKDKPQCSDGIDNDLDGAIDGFDTGCGGGDDDSEDISPYTITVPLPVVTLQATVSRKGVVTISKALIRAQRGSTVKVACSGKACPFKSFTRVMVTNSLKLTKLQHKYKPTLTITLRIQRADQLGKYLRYDVKRKAAPVRTDKCLDQSTSKVIPCFAD